MKEILSKFGFTDFLTYVCPGAIVLASLSMWIKIDYDSYFWNQYLLVTFLLLIIVYSLGLILASYNRKAQTQYMVLSQPPKRGWLVVLFRLFWKYSFMHPDQNYIEYSLLIKERLEKLDVPPGLMNIATYWEYIDIYRKLIIDRSRDENMVIELEATNYQRRSLFAMGISIATLLVAIQALFRVIIVQLSNTFEFLYKINAKLFHIETIYLIGIVVIGLIVSLGLRKVAFRMLIIELFLTASLRYPVNKKPKQNH